LQSRHWWSGIARAVVDESKKVNVWVMVHAVSGAAMLAAVEAGAPKLVYNPHFGWLSDDDARKVAAAGVKDLSTLAFGTPVFGVFADDNKPRFRDGQKWPDAILAGKARGGKPAIRQSMRVRCLITARNRRLRHSHRLSCRRPAWPKS
jgi:hypothetical protein